jgi:hypothetical protein
MEKKADIEFILKEGEEIVISGMSGRFPESDSTDEFANNLYNKLDMITDDSRRWPNGNNFFKFSYIFLMLCALRSKTFCLIVCKVFQRPALNSNFFIACSKMF